MRQLRFAQRKFVADDDRCRLHAFNNLWRKCICVLNPLMIEAGTTKVCLNRVAFEKDDAFHLSLEEPAILQGALASFTGLEERLVAGKVELTFDELLIN